MTPNGSSCRPRCVARTNRMYSDTTVNTIPRSPNPSSPSYANHPSHRELPCVRPLAPTTALGTDHPLMDSRHMGAFCTAAFPGRLLVGSLLVRPFMGAFLWGTVSAGPIPAAIIRTDSFFAGSPPRVLGTLSNFFLSFETVSPHSYHTFDLAVCKR